MIPVLESRPSFDNVDEFVQELNKARLQNKKKWITYCGTVEGCDVAIKTYDTGYLQILDVNDLRYGGGMDLKVGEWKTRIAQAIRNEVQKAA